MHCVPTLPPPERQVLSLLPYPPFTAERRFSMAKNSPVGDDARRGAVRDRSQVFNPQNQTWTKRDTGNGRFMDQKKDGDPFKGVRKEKKD